MKRKLITIVLMLVLTACMSVPVMAEQENTITELPLATTTDNMYDKTEIPCIDAANTIAKVTAPDNGLLEVSTEMFNIIPALYSDEACTVKVKDYSSLLPDGLWKVSAGATYYLKIKFTGIAGDEAMDKGVVKVQALFASASDITTTNNDNRLYAFGINEISYVQYTPEKSGIYSIGGSPTLCDSNRNPIGTVGRGNSYGLQGGVTYVFKFGKGFSDTGIDNMLIYKIQPAPLSIKPAAANMRAASSMKAVSIKHSYSSTVGAGFVLGEKVSSKWIKLKLLRSEKIYMLTSGLGIQGDFKTSLYNSKGKLLISDKTARSGGYLHSSSVSKGTYYLKVTKTTSKANGTAYVLLVGGKQGMIGF